MVRGIAFVIVAGVLLTAPANHAQQPSSSDPIGRAGAAGPGPTNGYAYADCSTANTPTVRLVIVTGAIPAAIPASTPQPSVVLVFNSNVDALSAQPSIGVSPGAARGGTDALALSCPVVGDCVPAQSGTISVSRRAEDGALIGTYQATWPGGQPRTGRFTATWRESQKRCG
jgi:hypothetical protein